MKPDGARTEPNVVPEPMLVEKLLAVVAGASLVAAGVGLLVHFKRRKREAKPPMTKTTFKGTVVLALLTGILVGSCLLRLAGANPYRGPGPLAQAPDTTPPSIIISGLIENKTYDVKPVPYLITIIKPSSWFNESVPEGILPIGKLLSIDLIIDGNWINLANDTYALADEYEKWHPVTLNGTLPELSEGKHTAQFSVECLVYYSSPDRPSFYGFWTAPDFPGKYFFTNRSAEVTFFIETVKPIGELEAENTYSQAFLALSAGGATTILAVGVLVYFKQRRRRAL